MKNHYELGLNSGRKTEKPSIASFGQNKNVRIHLTAVGAVIEADSPGINQLYAARAFADGSFGDYSVDYGSDAVRPAFWINLESDLF